MNNVEKKPEIIPHRRIAVKQFPSYEAAASAKKHWLEDLGVSKVKIIARSCGTYDLVKYTKLAAPAMAEIMLARNVKSAPGKKTNRKAAQP